MTPCAGTDPSTAMTGFPLWHFRRTTCRCECPKMACRINQWTVILGPLAHMSQRRRLQTIALFEPEPFGLYKVCFLEFFQMLGDRGLRHIEFSGEVLNGTGRNCEHCDDAATCRISNGFENEIFRDHKAILMGIVHKHCLIHKSGWSGAVSSFTSTVGVQNYRLREAVYGHYDK